MLLCIVNRYVLTLACQLVVEFNTTIRRSVSENLYVLEVKSLLVVVDVLKQLYELLYRVVLQLALTQVSLVDEELDLRLLPLCANALECIGSDASAASCESILVKF